MTYLNDLIVGLSAIAREVGKSERETLLLLQGSKGLPDETRFAGFIPHRKIGGDYVTTRSDLMSVACYDDAEQGDFRRLASRLREEELQRHDGRKFIADYLEGRGKDRQIEIRPRDDRAVLAVLVEKYLAAATRESGLSASDAIAYAMKHYGVTRKYATEALARSVAHRPSASIASVG